jgi:hypothetical protein
MSTPRSVVQRRWAGGEPDSLVHPVAPSVAPGRRWPHLLAYPLVLVAGFAIGLTSTGSADTAAASSPNATSTSASASIVTSSTTTASPVRRSQQAKPVGVSRFTDGTYLVGGAIKPGGYTTQGSSDGKGCYWARLRDTDGAFDSVITSGNITAGTTVAIERSDAAFELSGGCLWTRR